MPSISVIVPVHNGAAYLGRCLDAVTASAPFECIVANDGSTDGSEALAEEYPVVILNCAGGPYGPAYARNRGAEAARGEILLFVDADVVVSPSALRLAAEAFQRDPELAAVFGSYDARPEAPGVVSRYRNLLHHFVHQNGDPEASTFWAGLGAIRRSVFEKVGGFDEKRFHRPSIEDIDLGQRLRAAGYRIRLDKKIQGTHLKSWSLRSLLQTDISCRALPWSRLIVETGSAPNDLNLKTGQRASFVLTALGCAFAALAVRWPQALALAAAAFVSVIVINRKLYALFVREHGLLFAAACVPLHLLYFLYSGFSYLYVRAESLLAGIGTVRRSKFDLRSWGTEYLAQSRKARKGKR
jgi:GT2 family glycosyltransferase